jgi:DNA-binding protein HU-beta
MNAKAKKKIIKATTNKKAINAGKIKATTIRKMAKAGKTGEAASGAGPKKLGMDSLIGKMKETANLTKTEAANSVRGALQAIRDVTALAPEERRQTVKLRVAQFGTFSIKPTEAREGRNPKTGETIAVPAGYKLSFKPSTDWKESLQTMSDKQLGIG